MNTIKSDITTSEDIVRLVDSFYGKVRNDILLGPVFEERIGEDWSVHLDKMYRFWQTILLDSKTYFGSPFPPHATLPIGEAHFELWLKLFYETVDDHFAGEKADEAKWRAEKMAAMFLSKLNYFKENSAKPLV